MFIGCYSENLGVFGSSIAKVQNIDPHGRLMIFLPVLIFEGGFSSD